jgi:heat shock protein HslJ
MKENVNLIFYDCTHHHVMKNGIWFLIGLLIFAVMISGCTSQPSATVPSPQPAATTQQPVAQQTTVPAPALIGTNWKLGWYDDTKGVWSSVIEGSTITAIFASDEKISGAGGCNPYITDYHLGNAPMIWFRRPAVPETFCQTPTGVNSQETAYFTDLERADSYSITNGQLLLFDKTGRKILQFDHM